MAGNVQWNGGQFKKQLTLSLRANLTRAAIIVTRHAKELLSVSGTGVKRKGGAIVPKVKGMKGRTVYGAFPSKPGEPPRKQTGELRRRTTYEVDAAKGIARIGTNVKYGRWLEFGTSRMKPRPWLRRALAEVRSQVDTILKSTIR